MKVVSWGHGFGRWHADLTNAANRDLRAARDRRDGPCVPRASCPGAPVFLVGKSGGTGLVVRALERLPEDTVEWAVLLSPALSPTYDLAPALRAVRREMVVFWSPLDVIVLGLGTRIFGTIDRIKTVSAGLVGLPRAAGGRRRTEQASYRKLRQVRWCLEMAPRVTWEVTLVPTVRPFSRNMSYRCCGLAMQRIVELCSVSSRPHGAPITIGPTDGGLRCRDRSERWDSGDVAPESSPRRTCTARCSFDFLLGCGQTERALAWRSGEGLATMRGASRKPLDGEDGALTSGRGSPASEPRTYGPRPGVA